MKQRSPLPREVDTIPRMIAHAAVAYGDRAALVSRTPDRGLVPLSYRELHRQVVALATALIELGLQAGERVCLFADNRREWMLISLAAQFAGGCDVPRGADVTEPELRHIVPHSGARLIFVENSALLERLRRSGCDSTIPVFRIEPQSGTPQLPDAGSLAALLEQGEALRSGGDRRVEERVAVLGGADLHALIYTSGTTGVPKGVQLSHANMLSQMRNIPFTLDTRDRVLSILPIWHAYERMFELACLSLGATTYYGSVRSLADDFREVRPTFMASAPRLWESVHARLEHRIRSGGARHRALFRFAQRVSRAWRGSWFFLRGRALDLSGRPRPDLLVFHLGRWLLLALPGAALDLLVMRRLRQVVGGRLRGTISGGGALPIHIDEFLNYAGIPLLEGYGLTETSPVVAVRTWGKRVIGTVGPPYPGTEIRLVDLATGAVVYPDPSEHRRGAGRGRRGEIQVRGPQVMQGYYRDPEGTARVLSDGWFRTGDLGVVTWNDCLKIVGRSKDTIVLRSGENVEPEPIENELRKLPLIAQCMLIGSDQRHLALLVVPSPEELRGRGLAVEGDLAAVSHDESARRLIEQEVSALIHPSRGWKSFERIAAVRLLPAPFEVGDELTATFKIRRHHVLAKYAELVAELFADSGKP